MSELLEIRDLSIALPPGADRPLAVENLSLRVRRGQTLCVVGESGSGKSLAAAAIVRLLPSTALRITAGQVLFDGRDTLAMDTDELLAIRGGRIGYVFQDPLSCLNPLERVGVQVREVLDRHGWPGDRHQRVQEMLTDVGLPSPDTLVHKYPWQLSGGQRQRVMIAIALAADPALVIADEPTTALDVTTQAQILRLLREMQARRNLGLLLITHDFGVVSEMADEVAVLKDGRLIEHGPRDAVLRDPKQDYTRRLLAAVPPLTPRTLRTPTEPLLAATALGKTWHTRGGLWRRGTSTHAVADVALTVGRGETVAVVGESGSGKSTLARLLVRLTDADHGTARLEGLGDDYLALPAHALAPLRRAVQMVFQDPFASLNPRMRVAEIMEEGVASLRPEIGAGDRRDRVVELLRKVGLHADAATRYPHEFSGGQRQRIAIARALAVEPELIICDEPTSALDVSVQAQILNLLAQLQRELGVAYLFITHNFGVVEYLAHEIAVMQSGRIVEAGPAEQVLSQPQHAYTRTLLAAVPRLARAA